MSNFYFFCGQRSVKWLALATAILCAAFTAQVSAAGTGWSGQTVISPTFQPDPTRGAQLNDVAVNLNGLTIAAWDQYTYNNGGGATIGAAVQSGGRWAAPFTISGPTGYSMSPRVAVGANGTMAVSWTYQDPLSDPVNYPNPVQKIQVAVLPAGATAWTTSTLDQGPIGGVAITQFVPVGVDAQGNITAAWSMWDGVKHVVKAAIKPNGGAWSAAVNVSSAEDGIFPVLSVNARGDAGVVFAISPYTSTTGSCEPLQQGTCALYAFRSGANGGWSAPLRVSERMSSNVGYISGPQVSLDANGQATVIYMGYGIESVREVSPGSWTVPASIIQTNIAGASYMSSDLAVDASGNAVAALSIFDPTPGVDRASVWVARGTSGGAWSPAERITDPSVPVDAYATRVAVAPNGSLALVGWIDHYHGVAQVSKLTGNLDQVLNSTGSFWGKAVTIGKSTAFSAFQEVMGLDAASDNSGSAAKARAIWKSAKSGTQIYTSGYSQ